LAEEQEFRKPPPKQHRQPKQGEPWGPLSPEDRREQSRVYLERLLQLAQQRDGRLARQKEYQAKSGQAGEPEGHLAGAPPSSSPTQPARSKPTTQYGIVGDGEE
jgi:hypothetical protein